MRVLHLPVNYGSLPSHTVRALRQIGVEARGLIRTDKVLNASTDLKVIGLNPQASLPQLLLPTLSWIYHFIKLLKWADVLHWYFGPALPLGLDLALVRFLRKPGLIEWQGSDIRVPEWEFAENPYYAAAFSNGYEYQQYESHEKSRQRQQRFREAGFACCVPVGMRQYVQKDIFPHPYFIPQRLIVSDYEPVFPSLNVSQPIIAHAPSRPIAKGTAAVLRAVDQLSAKYNFQFHLIQGMPRDQALKLMASADIFLDQFVWGDFGMASLEAMALGKPVICYVKPSLAAQYSPELPIVKATADNLAEMLEGLLANSSRRREVGQQSRAYIEKNHNALDVATQLKDIYAELLQRKHS